MENSELLKNWSNSSKKHSNFLRIVNQDGLLHQLRQIIDIFEQEYYYIQQQMIKISRPIAAVQSSAELIQENVVKYLQNNLIDGDKIEQYQRVNLDHKKQLELYYQSLEVGKYINQKSLQEFFYKYELCIKMQKKIAERQKQQNVQNQNDEQDETEKLNREIYLAWLEKEQYLYELSQLKKQLLTFTQYSDCNFEQFKEQEQIYQTNLAELEAQNEKIQQKIQQNQTQIEQLIQNLKYEENQFEEYSEDEQSQQQYQQQQQQLDRFNMVEQVVKKNFLILIEKSKDTSKQLQSIQELINRQFIQQIKKISPVDYEFQCIQYSEDIDSLPESIPERFTFQEKQNKMPSKLDIKICLNHLTLYLTDYIKKQPQHQPIPLVVIVYTSEKNQLKEEQCIKQFCDFIRESNHIDIVWFWQSKNIDQNLSAHLFNKQDSDCLILNKIMEQIINDKQKIQLILTQNQQQIKQYIEEIVNTVQQQRQEQQQIELQDLSGLKDQITTKDKRYQQQITKSIKISEIEKQIEEIKRQICKNYNKLEINEQHKSQIQQLCQQKQQNEVQYHREQINKIQDQIKLHDQELKEMYLKIENMQSQLQNIQQKNSNQQQLKKQIKNQFSDYQIAVIEHTNSAVIEKEYDNSLSMILQNALKQKQNLQCIIECLNQISLYFESLMHTFAVGKAFQSLETQNIQKAQYSSNQEEKQYFSIVQKFKQINQYFRYSQKDPQYIQNIDITKKRKIKDEAQKSDLRYSDQDQSTAYKQMTEEQQQLLQKIVSQLKSLQNNLICDFKELAKKMIQF